MMMMMTLELGSSCSLPAFADDCVWCFPIGTTYGDRPSPNQGRVLLRASNLRSTSGLPTQKARVRRFFLDFAFFFLWAPGNIAAYSLLQA